MIADTPRPVPADPSTPDRGFRSRARRFLRTYPYAEIAREVSSIAKWFDCLVQCAPVAGDDQMLYSAIQAPEKHSRENLGNISRDFSDRLVAFLLNANVNTDEDPHKLLEVLQTQMNRHSRIILVVYSAYWNFLFRFLDAIGLRHSRPMTTFITNRDLRNIARAAQLEITRTEPTLYFPFRWLFVGPLLNRILRLVPVLRWTALVEVVVLRPIRRETEAPSLSVIVPARNEAGNLRGLTDRLESFRDIPLELIFVEGNSTDDTWKVIQEVVAGYKGPFQLRCLQQKGKGKKDAVEAGFAVARGEVLTILDADLTMPPEYLMRFYSAYRAGIGDVINGNRMVYPREAEAMRFLNSLGNVFFGKALSRVLDIEIGDSLCGTKLFSRRHYEAFVRWNRAFGDFDPFGDFALLFPAAAVGFGVFDLAVPYKARSYGTTNIQRFTHGLMLLKMVVIGYFRIKARWK